MWVETYHIFVVITLDKVNWTIDMGNYTFTRDVYVLGVLDMVQHEILQKRHSRRGAVKGSSDF